MFLRIILIVLTVPNCHSFLEIKLQPSKGRNATLVCKYPVEATTVIWTRVGVGTITSCFVPGTCLPLVNNRYHCSVSRLYSNITITHSRQSEDSGEWKCTVNDLYHSSVNLLVSTLPSSFYFTNAPATEVFITQSGLDLHARAVCVFPQLTEVSLHYMIKGDNTFNLFTKRKPDIYFAGGSTQNCDKHEYIMLTQITLKEEDFLDLTMLFRMQYTALTGDVIQSQTTSYVVFPGHPCQSKPCQNGGECKVLSFSHYHCSCPTRYTGQDCDVKVNPCVSNPCENYGVCHGNEDHFTFTCKCQNGYTGFTCQESTSSAPFHKEKGLFITITTIQVVLLSALV
ncbi:uncharacterized protein LOC133186075 [Saccostrea echinata]|uniref:uncharacterized protein LOC133186075 n=1 Tax=Saccostrea echinata TaxID=191078 RepID=UPI002A7ED024|nr:uncharacterized protein LOC133186075 [Saccostrea echinata]